LAVFEDHNATLEAINDSTVVCCHNDGGAGSTDALEKVHNLLAGGWVKVSGWLIGK
jgi:hypothetical protein